MSVSKRIKEYRKEHQVVLPIKGNKLDMVLASPINELSLSYIKILKQYTKKGIDKNGIEWTDEVTVYNVQMTPVNSKNGDNGDISSKTTLATLPPINAEIQACVGKNSLNTYVRYYGRCYADLLVTAQMTMSLLYMPPTGGNWIIQATQPTYTATGTAVATPIYVYRWPDWGYWMSRNTFSVLAPGYDN